MLYRNCMSSDHLADDDGGQRPSLFPVFQRVDDLIGQIGGGAGTAGDCYAATVLELPGLDAVYIIDQIDMWDPLFLSDLSQTLELLE